MYSKAIRLVATTTTIRQGRRRHKHNGGEVVGTQLILLLARRSTSTSTSTYSSRRFNIHTFSSTGAAMTSASRFFATSSNDNNNNNNTSDKEREALFRALQSNENNNNNNDSSVVSSTPDEKRSASMNRQHKQQQKEDATTDTRQSILPTPKRKYNGKKTNMERPRNPDGLIGGRISSSSSSSNSNSKPNKTKRKSTTLDDFFSNMGTSKKETKHTNHQRFEHSSITKRQGIMEKLSTTSSTSSSSSDKKHNRQPSNSSITSTAASVRNNYNDNDDHNNKKKTTSSISSFFDEVDAIVKQRTKEKNDLTGGKSASASSSRLFAISGGDAAPRKSIFDAMSAAANKNNDDAATTMMSPNTTTTTTTTTTYDQYAYDEYLDQMEKIIGGPKFVRTHTRRRKGRQASSSSSSKKTNSLMTDDDDIASVIEWLKAEEPIVVPCHLPTLDKALSGSSTSTSSTTITGLSSKEEASKQFKQELQAQHDAFVQHFGWNQTQVDIAVGGLSQIGTICAKTASGAPLEIAWSKLKEMGVLTMKNNQKSLVNFLYVSSIFSSSSSSSTQQQQQQQSGILSSSSQTGGSVLDFLYNDEESSSLSSSNNDNKSKKSRIESDDGPSGALKKEETPVVVPVVDLANEIAMCHDLLYGPSERSTSVRARSLVSQGRAREAEALLNDNPTSDDLRLRAYTPVFQCYLNQGDVDAAFQLFAKMSQGKGVQLQSDTYIQLIAGVAENGYFRRDSKPVSGIKELGYAADRGPELFDLLASEMADTAVEIPSASAKRLYNAFQNGFDGYYGPGCGLERLHILQSLHLCNDMAAPDALVASRVSLDKTTGGCPRTGAHLRLINLDAEQKQQLQNSLLSLAGSAYEERHSVKNSTAQDGLRKFGEWLRSRKGKPFTAMVDGPNVAYYMQSFEQGSFNFHQIKFVVDALESMGENVLVILPEKYTRNSFSLQSLSRNTRQRLTAKEKQIRDELSSSGKLYIVPPGLLDDYYWMYASVCSQLESGKENDMYIPPGNPEGRCPGIRPMLVSNDKMRDHKLSLLEPRLFRRWYSNFIVNFTFSAFVDDHCADKQIGFSTADFYSREIQGNVTTDENGQECGTAWHFPVTDWNDHESFCIRIPKNI